MNTIYTKRERGGDRNKMGRKGQRWKIGNQVCGSGNWDTATETGWRRGHIELSVYSLYLTEHKNLRASADHIANDVIACSHGDAEKF
jgi:hypothetical protein